MEGHCKCCRFTPRRYKITQQWYCYTLLLSLFSLWALPPLCLVLLTSLHKKSPEISHATTRGGKTMRQKKDGTAFPTPTIFLPTDAATMAGDAWHEGQEACAFIVHRFCLIRNIRQSACIVETFRWCKTASDWNKLYNRTKFLTFVTRFPRTNKAYIRNILFQIPYINCVS